MALKLKKGDKEPKAEKAPKPERASKAAAPKKGKSKQFVLLIGDEGAILVFMEGSKVVRRLFAPTPRPTSTEAMTQLMQTNPKVPVSILVDNIDQQFVRQTFPPVSALSVGGLVKRRLDRDFQAEDIKGSLAIGRDKDGRKEWNYLLISLTKTPVLTEWLDLIIELPNELKGIYLLPVEATNYINMLMGATNNNSPKQWQLLVTHNKVSGFRQVVVNNGKLVFTRVTQAIDDAIPAVIAGNIEQEIINTLEYLRRLGFQDSAGLDIYVVASADVTQVLDLNRFNMGSTSALTPLDIADGLGMEQAALSADRFGDVVMAAAFLRAKKHVLKFSTAYAESLGKLYTIRKAVKVGAILIAVILLGLSVQNVLGSIENLSLASTSLEKRKGVKEQLDGLQTKVSGLNKNLAYKSAVVSTYDAYVKNSFQPTEFMGKLAPLLSPTERINSVEWTTDTSSGTTRTSGNAAAAAAVAAAKVPLQIRAEFEFKGNYADIDALAKAENAFLDKLATSLPEYEVTHDPFPWQKDAEKGMEISFDQKPSEGIKQGNNKLVIQFALKKADKGGAAASARGATAPAPGGAPMPGGAAAPGGPGGPSARPPSPDGKGPAR